MLLAVFYHSSLEALNHLNNHDNDGMSLLQHFILQTHCFNAKGCSFVAENLNMESWSCRETNT